MLNALNIDHSTLSIVMLIAVNDVTKTYTVGSTRLTVLACERASARGRLVSRRLCADDVEAFDGAPKLVRGYSRVTLG